ncbi:MAG: alkaline phosphatase family protein [Burkholderiaceae bacterium]|jgi:hypothetical protein|nr:alkaline phosphatase family protein [Burkholderiaceae bacterium]
MTKILGPVLGFRGVSACGWRVSILIVTDGAAPRIEVVAPAEIAVTAPRKISKSGNRTAWRSDVTIAQKPDAETEVCYRIGARQTHAFTVPGSNMMPRMAYGSCNGFSEPKAMKSVDENNRLWGVLFNKHAEQPYHLMLHGGDQVYADSLWAVVPAMRDWAELPFKEGNKAKFTPQMKAAVDKFYFDLYCTRWSQPKVAEVLASIPSVMMWDDHDITDGWGSYNTERQHSEVFQGLFESARRHFAAFQLHGSAQDEESSVFFKPDKGFSFGHVFGKLGLVVLDMRSERSQTQVLGKESWNSVFNWIDQHKELDHLFVMSSIPVVHPSLGLLESLLKLVPGQQELEDDFKDHWSSRSHLAERLRLVHRLLNFSAAEKTRVTILSGDVHVAALGIIESQRNVAATCNSQVINQLTSSGIVHPPPSALTAFALDRLFDNKEDIDRGITLVMEKFPGTQKRFLAERNWLSLEPDAPDGANRIWANWFTESTQEPYTKVIHPVADEA